ncbi:MAG: hypothetical protein QM781_17005 [Chitinophagaceae bacterium]
MKTYFLVLIVATTFLACKKGDTGPQGPEGPAGIQGPQGIIGNANVTQYTFGAQNLTSSFSQLQITTTQDTMNRSLWFVYLYYQPLERWYFVPGSGFGGSSTYRVSLTYTGGKATIYIDKSGPGENYAQARVIRVYANNVTTGGRAGSDRSPAVDFSDYQAVRQYYQLPE